MDGFTHFTKLAAEEIKGAEVGSVSLSKAAGYSLTAEEKRNLYISCTMTAASKTLTLGLAKGQVVFIHNAGATNAFTLKNLSGDTGTSLAAGKVALVVGSATANDTVVLVLN